MRDVDVVRRRLVETRLTGEPLRTTREVVRWLGAVQGQELAEARWSLAMRMRPGTTEGEVAAALDRGEVLRTHVLRPTWHLVAPEDLRWLLRLTARRVQRANAHPYERDGLDAGQLVRGEAVVARELADGEPRTRHELQAALERERLDTRRGSRLSYLLMHAELEEIAVSGPARGKQQTYVAFDDRVPPLREPFDRDRALRDLAHRYVRGRGPATVEDLARFGGLTLTDARAAFALADDLLEPFGDTDLVVACDTVAPRARRPRGFLAPMYDELHTTLRAPALAWASPRPSGEGSFQRPIVLRGRTVGTWRRTLSPQRVTVEATLFATLARDDERALDAAVERFGAFLGRTARLDRASGG